MLENLPETQRSRATKKGDAAAKNNAGKFYTCNKQPSLYLSTTIKEGNILFWLILSWFFTLNLQSIPLMYANCKG